MRFNFTRLVFIGALLVPVLVSIAIIGVLLWGDDLVRSFEPPPPPPNQQLELSDDGRTLFVEDSGARIAIPEKWHAELTAKEGEFRIVPDLQLTRCEIRVREEKNQGGEAAPALLRRYEAARRFEKNTRERQTKLIEVSGWQAAYFEWKNENFIRYREVYVQHGVWILWLLYVEDLNALDKQAVPCYHDFTALLEQGITL